jgi:hypothetical protein
MDRRFVFPQLAAAAIMFACGPRPHGRGEALATMRHDGTASVAKPAKSAKPRHSRLDSPVDAALTVTGDRELQFALAVANRSEHRLELAFADGRTRDFAVFDAAGREVWRWSRGRIFTQGMQTSMIAPGDSVVYAERWVPTAPGRYTLVAELRSENYPASRQVTFEVPAPPSAEPTATRVTAH